MKNFSQAGTIRLTALVTGASSGIGSHYADQLALRGCNVLLISNQAGQIRETAARIASKYGYADLSPMPENLNTEEYIENQTHLRESEPRETGNGTLSESPWVMGLYKDLAEAEAARELWEFCKEKGMEVDILINNAGIFFFKDTIDCTPEKVRAILNLHVVTSTMLCRYFGEDMKKRKRGYILNMSSISVHTPFPGISLYTATKSFIRTFTKALHYEMKDYGVKVVAVSPGAVATDLYNLPPHLQKLGVRLGIIYRPGRLADKALNKLAKGKIEFIPGFVNRFYKPFFAILPGWFKMMARRKLKTLMK